MHKLKQLSVSSFLRLLFAAFTFAFFCSAFIAPDRAEMFTGLRRIMTESSKVSTNYFDNGGYAGTFLNAGLVCLVLTALYSLPKVKVNATSCLAFLLTAGFCFWGVNILNLWFGFLGVLLYCLVKRENPANQINAMVFTTGICPLFTDLMIRYPHADVVASAGRASCWRSPSACSSASACPPGWPTRRRCTRAMTSIPPRCPSA